MKYTKTVTLKDSRQCLIRSAESGDAQAVMDVFLLTHDQTDFLASYGDEGSFDVDFGGGGQATPACGNAVCRPAPPLMISRRPGRPFARVSLLKYIIRFSYRISISAPAVRNLRRLFCTRR